MRKELTPQDIVKGIKAKDLAILSRAITIVESKKEAHRELAREIIKEILPLTGKAKRIGISGTPGVGKVNLECKNKKGKMKNIFDLN